jgi:acyl-CoA hydrolase
MLSDGFLSLYETGALDGNFQHTTCVAVGSRAFYERIGDLPSMRIIGCEVTHDPSHIARLERFVAVNSAVEVDLFGQCNLEHIGGGAVSGMGGAPDFARAARASLDGVSIVALNAKHKSDSRIVCTLKSPSVSTLPRCDVDYIITEHGTANLIGKSVHERAQALIGVAAPEFRSLLSAEWDAVAARL